MSTVPILYSESTSPLLVDYFKSAFDCPSANYTGCKADSHFIFVVYKISNYSDLDAIFINSDVVIILDATASLGTSAIINEYARKIGFLQCIIGYPPENALSYAFYSYFSLDSYAKAALSIAKHYSIDKAIAIITSDFVEMDFNNDEGIEIVSQIFIPQAATYDYIFWLISKQIKPLGIKWFFLKTNPEISKLIQQALIEADMNKEGYTYIYIQEAAWGAYLEGSILLEAKTWHSTDFKNYVYNLIHFAANNVYSLFTNNRAQGSFSGYILNTLLANVLKPEVMGFTVWNVKNGTVKKAGIINGAGFQLYSDLVFPGGTYDHPNSEKIKIPISINGASYDNDGLNTVNQVGADLAINTIKAENVFLSNFEIVVNNVTGFEFNENFTYIDDLGYFYISATESQLVLDTMKFFKENSILTPVLGVETSTIMSSLEYYPQYARVSYPNSRTASAAALILSVFGISKCSVLYTDSQWGEDFNKEFENQSDSYEISILNKKRVVPLGFNGSDTKIIQEIIDLKTRFVILEVHKPDIFYIIEAFYDLGMRKGDIYLIVGDGMISTSDLNEKLIGKNSYTKRKEIMSGLIYISFISFQNQFGFNLKSEFLSKYGYINDYMCLYYDAAYLGLKAINTLMNWGVNLNSSSIQDTVREIAFTGCSGVVRISQEGNDRITTILGIYNLIEINSTWTMNLCGEYDPSQLIVLQIKQSISWSDNGGVPSDIIGDGQECPFRDILVQSFRYGYIILIIIEIIPIIFGTFFAMKFYNIIFKQKYPKLITAQKENVLDIFSYFMFLIENLQYTQMCPDFKDFFPRWSNGTKLVFFDIRGIFKNGLFTFWNQVQLYEALVFAWILLFLIKNLNNQKNFILSTVNEFSLYIMPIIGEILFLPINLYLFQTFQCTSSIGDNFKDSFNDHYCSTFCWQGDHINYVIISSLALSVYIPTSLYYRFTWKSDLPFHFQEHPFHLALKSTVQIIFIIFATIVSPASKNAFSGLCIGLLLIYLIISAITKPLNYDRASLWYIIFIASALLFWCCCAISKLDDKLTALILLAIGLIILTMFGAVYQKLRLPCLLEAEKAINIVGLFRFQLSSSSPEMAGIIKTKPLRYVYIENDAPQSSEAKTLQLLKSTKSYIPEEDNVKSSAQLFEIET
ncbi:unnamed protein product [Blepharisma stoltei]|uniref:Receptor ligand binding region domain-containing protein n=1 Tax=Blepharisma stoltei TaxID=1481888 RepID=A0AAU9JPZ2_9CILI|nr:unnamed protein product [Blepharisma stoltei]